MMMMMALCPIRIWHGGGGARIEAQRWGEAESGDRTNHPERTSDHSAGRGEDTEKPALTLQHFNTFWQHTLSCVVYRNNEQLTYIHYRTRGNIIPGQYSNILRTFKVFSTFENFHFLSLSSGAHSNKRSFDYTTYYLLIRCVCSTRPRLHWTPRLRGTSRLHWPRSAPTGRQ